MQSLKNHWSDKIDGFINIDNGIIYLVLLEYNEIYHKIKYPISKKSDIKDSTNNNLARIRIDSYNPLLIGKILTFHNVNENKNHYYYNVFLEIGLYIDKSNNNIFK